MALNRMHVRPLLTAAEYLLFESSVGDGLKRLTAAQLRAKVGRARKLRDKYTDLLRRQKVDSRSRSGSKGGATGVANARTGQKSTVFAEVLHRFEKRLEQCEAVEARAVVRANKATPANKAIRATKANKAKKATRATGETRSARPKRVLAPASIIEARRTAKSLQSDGLQPAVSSKAPATAPGRSRGSAAGPTKESARSKRHQKQFQESRSKPIQAHVSSQGRRTQAGRDRRG